MEQSEKLLAEAEKHIAMATRMLGATDATSSLEQRLAEAEARRIDARLKERANAIGNHVLELMSKNNGIPDSTTAKRIVQLLVLRSLLIEGRSVKVAGRGLKEIADVIGTNVDGPRIDPRDLVEQI